MAGILDPKTRVLDTIITSTGRAQLATGEIRVKFASFSDGQVFYSKKNAIELDDPGRLLSLEAASTDSDLVIQEVDADANLKPIVTDNVVYRDGKVISGSVAETDMSIYGNLLTDDSIQSLQRLRIIGTRNLLTNERSDAFSLSPATTDFYTNAVLENSSTGYVVTGNLDNIESIWQDYRVATIPNYQYLPPQNLPLPSEVTGSTIGSYPKINVEPITTLDELNATLQGKQSQKLTFSNTRTSNDVIGQIFEVNEKKLSKLVMIEGGYIQNDSGPDKHVYYAGKIYRDSRGILTFVNIFTLVFE